MATMLAPEEADRTLGIHAPDWWRAWNSRAIEEICTAVPEDALARWPRVAHWRGLASFMSEGADALACLDAAYRGHVDLGDGAACAHDASAALVICLLDVGAMDRVDDWLSRADLHAQAASPDSVDWWWHAGILARGVLGADHGEQAALSAHWLGRQLMVLHNLLSADERLIAAQVLVNHHLANEHYEQFDLLVSLVESGQPFATASPLMRARWRYTLGFAHYQIGNHQRAETAWHAALETARQHGLAVTNLVTSLAIVRLMVDRGRVVEARQIERQIDPGWGGGRASQLVLLQQMRARVLLLEHQSVRAHATLGEALALASQSGLSPPEMASCLTDMVQVLIAMHRFGEAEAKLLELIRDHRGRDANVYRCLQRLLSAWQMRDLDVAASRTLLSEGLALAQQLRYTMFFRLLPNFAATVCGLALKRDVEATFVKEVIRDRALAAPPDADSRWPWPLWLRMLGEFKLIFNVEQQAGGGRAQPKPLELLRLLACRTSMSAGLLEAAEHLWPDADESARKNIEMTVQRLRRLLQDDTLVIVEENRVSLDATRISSDVRCRRLLIERLGLMATRVAGLAPGVEFPGSSECASVVASVRELGLGPLLPGVAPATWLDMERDRCEREVAEAALAAAQVMRHSGATPGEQELLELALRHQPLQERLVCRLVEAYARDGRRIDALRVYEAFRTALRKENATIDSTTEALLRRWLAAGA